MKVNVKIRISGFRNGPDQVVVRENATATYPDRVDSLNAGGEVCEVHARHSQEILVYTVCTIQSMSMDVSHLMCVCGSYIEKLEVEDKTGKENIGGLSNFKN